MTTKELIDKLREVDPELSAEVVVQVDGCCAPVQERHVIKANDEVWIDLG